MGSHERNLGTFYDKWSPKLLDDWSVLRETLAIHWGFNNYRTTSLKQSILEMNNFVAALLDLFENKDSVILDAGCGIGGTSIYLAKKYSKVKFIGITIAKKQAEFARKFAKDRKVTNTKFKHKNYCDTGFKDNTFDGIFALESFEYCQDYEKFFKEMYRILKPGGRLVVIDVFRRKIKLNNIMENVYRQFIKDFGNPDLLTISEYKKYLKKYGFVDPYIKDVTMNISPSIIYWSILCLPRFLKKFFKKYNLKDEDGLVTETAGGVVPGLLCGLFGVTKYYGTSAVKK